LIREARVRDGRPTIVNLEVKVSQPHPLANPKWSLPEGGACMRIAREELMLRIQQNLDRLDVPWNEAVNARWSELFGPEDSQAVADRVFERFQAEEGRKFYAGSEIAFMEDPDHYILRANLELDVDPSEFAEGVIGDGDNVFQTEDVTGTVLVVREVEVVDRLIEEGVPEGTIGVIDDAGGTMSAPILADFEAVICLAGSIRSHLAIIGREFGVPTLMASRLSRPLKTGERVTVSYSSPAQSADSYFGDEVTPRAEIRPATEEA
jgi:phosphohistidine swiveling domain-containing protein